MQKYIETFNAAQPPYEKDIVKAVIDAPHKRNHSIGIYIQDTYNAVFKKRGTYVWFDSHLNQSNKDYTFFRIQDVVYEATDMYVHESGYLTWIRDLVWGKPCIQIVTVSFEVSHI
jgi:hypothetical protein